MARPFVVGLIGAGVGPSLTPPMHEAEGAAHGLTYTYRTIDITELGIEPEQVGEVLRWGHKLGFDAFNITHPCKQLVLEHLDEIDPTAQALEAVNTVVIREGKLIGFNTDVTGYAGAFRKGLPDATTTEVVQVGAGGAGSAVAEALTRLGVERLTVVDMDSTRAENVASSLQQRHPDTTIKAGSPDQLADLLHTAHGLVNCTPMGMAHHPGMSVPAELLEPRLWVSDVVYRPLDTELLHTARELGCPTLHGGFMAVGQAVDAFRLITGVEPNQPRMMDHFNTLAASPATAQSR